MRNGLGGLPEENKFKIDAAICFKALSWMVRHDEWVRKTAIADALKVAKIGNERIKRLQAGEHAVPLKPGKHVLAYQSFVDGSLQPYAVSLPEGWRAGDTKRWPLYLVLHGRSNDMNEVAFITGHDGKPPVKDSTWIQLDVYGRGNNAYRWAGETDVFEALADVKRRFLIDERRITLWGFSMGGAGSWHLGLQHPDMWSSVGPGAGFVDFYKYQKIDQPLPDVQNKMLRIYDSKDYALNMFDVPVIAYCGEVDPAVEQTLLMQDAARALKAPLAVLIGHKMPHKFDDMNLKTFMAFHAAHSEKGRPEFPGLRDVKFVTYTLKFNKFDWFRIEEQEEPYERTEVISTFSDGVLNVTTENVRALAIARGAADAIILDGGAKVALASAAGGDLPDVYFRLEADGWKLLSYQDSLAFADNVKHHKRHGLQGPIDDAFTQPFVLVEGTGHRGNDALRGLPWQFEMQRVQREWDQWFRGELRVVRDVDLSDADIASRNLILFGDPDHNAVIAKIADQLPVRWKDDTIQIGRRSFAARDHYVAMIFPNPLNPSKYVVLNSGPTVKADEYAKSNAWFFPRLGDAAVLQWRPSGTSTIATTPVWSTIMNSDWEIEE